MQDAICVDPEQKVVDGWVTCDVIRGKQQFFIASGTGYDPSIIFMVGVILGLSMIMILSKLSK